MDQACHVGAAQRWSSEVSSTRDTVPLASDIKTAARHSRHGSARSYRRVCRGIQNLPEHHALRTRKSPSTLCRMPAPDSGRRTGSHSRDQ
jgi:hypothetical protein